MEDHGEGGVSQTIRAGGTEKNNKNAIVTILGQNTILAAILYHLMILVIQIQQGVFNQNVHIYVFFKTSPCG